MDLSLLHNLSSGACVFSGSGCRTLGFRLLQLCYTEHLGIRRHHAPVAHSEGILLYGGHHRSNLPDRLGGPIGGSSHNTWRKEIAAAHFVADATYSLV